MVKNAKQGASDLMQELREKITGDDRQVFIVSHKGAEASLQGYDTGFKCMLGHWGAIDGSNKFRNCDTVVIYGLPYLPDYWTANVFMALQEPQETDWLRDPSKRQYGDHEDIRQALKNGQISTSIIQAINRIRSRKVIDVAGNCPHAEIYMLLPEGRLAEMILNDIKRMMPGIIIDESWQYNQHRRKLRKASYEPSLLTYIDTLAPGRYSKARVKRELGISSDDVMDRLLTKCRSDGSQLHEALMGNQVELRTDRAGKINKTYFIKQ